jgi:hypothetical protein
MADFVLSAPEKWQESPSEECLGSREQAQTVGLMAPGTSRPMTGDRGLVLSWHLPRDRLIEFVIRCRLGLGVEPVLPGIRHLHSGGPRAGEKRAGERRSPKCTRIWRTVGASVGDDAHLRATERRIAAIKSEPAARKRRLGRLSMSPLGRSRPVKRS